jgi:hypothetical protein
MIEERNLITIQVRKKGRWMLLPVIVNESSSVNSDLQRKRSLPDLRSKPSLVHRIFKNALSRRASSVGVPDFALNVN